MKFILLFLFIQTAKSQIITHGDFYQHIDSFEKITKVSVPVILRITYSTNVSSDRIGHCVMGQYHIEIDSNKYNKLTALEQRLIIWHELGHCVLNLRHTTEKFRNGCPKSLMYPALFNKGHIKYCYKKRRKYYHRDIKIRGIHEKEKNTRPSD